MNKFSVIFSTAAFVLGMFGLVFVSSCNKGDIKYNDTTNVRPCNNVICLNGGNCVDGYCYCPAGYEGDKCQTPWNQKFVGSYKVSDACYTGADLYYTATIQAVTNQATKITLSNLGTFCPTGTLQAVVKAEKTAFEIPLQQGCGDIYIYGSGNINPNLQYINVYLTARDSINHTSTSCSLLLTKQ